MIIIGAGPAGLTTATYLGRFHRRALAPDGGTSRARWIPESHNTPGFPHGVGGETLLATGVEDSIRERRDEDGRLVVSAHQRTSVDRLYAAGDVVRGLNQIAIATAEAAIAATDMHNQFRALESRLKA